MFRRVLGQDAAIGTLETALRTGRVHHAYRFEGPAGVGKELTALAFAAALQCERRDVAPCGECRECERATRFSEDAPHVPRHPDVVLIGRGLYGAAILGREESQNIGIAQVRRLVLARAGYAPHEGRALVFIVRDADDLSVEAANALLKTLEEPAPGQHFILLTSRPSRLLDTVRSRSLPLRFAPLSEAVLAELLAARGLDPAVASEAEGSAAQAFALADPERSAARRELVARVLACVDAPDLVPALDLDDRGRGREESIALFEAVGHALAARSRRLLESDAREAVRDAERHAAVLAGQRDLEANVSPALVLETTISRMRRVIAS